MAALVTEAQCITATRLRQLHAWRPHAHPLKSQVIGTGKYGTVFALERCDSTVVKENFINASKTHLCKQAFREHVIGLLQTLMVLDGYSPHLPLHHGMSWLLCPGNTHLRGHIYMERFHGSLGDLGARCLRSDLDWQSLLFQVLSALTALAAVFEICHNDAYPRNILLNLDMRAARVLYSCDGTLYAVPWPFLVVLTDFGIATSSKILGKNTLPEVVENLEALEVGPCYGTQPPLKHVLHYKQLPMFARDAYTVLKWTAFAHKNMPPPPSSTLKWSRAALSLLDEVGPGLCAPSTLTSTFKTIFSAKWTQMCKLPTLEQESVAAERPDFIFPLSERKKTELLCAATEALANLPLPARSAQDAGKH